MSLIERYATDFTSDVAVHKFRRDGQRNIENQIGSIEEKDQNEKRYLNSLNNRLENLLKYLEDLETKHKNSRNELKRLVSSWGFESERERVLKEFDQLTRHLSTEHRRKVRFEVETKLFEEQTQMTERLAAMFIDVTNFYRDQQEIFLELIPEFENELRQIEKRWKISDNLVKTVDDEYQKELKKFRQYLVEWSKISLEKSKLFNEIQSLREQFHLRLAFNQEELNEWRRLLTRSSEESKNFYRNYLDTIKQQLQLDYQQMLKDQQRDLDLEFRTKLKEIQEQMKISSTVEENRSNDDERRWQSRLNDRRKDFERYQNEFRKLNEENQRKRRIFKDLDNERRNKARRQAEHTDRLIRDRDLSKAEYNLIKDQLDQLAEKLKFGIEEELKIYETLLNSFQQRKETRTTRTKTKTNVVPEVPVSSIVDKTTIKTGGTTDLYDVERNLLDRLAQRKTTTTTRRLSQQTKNINGYRQQQKSIPELDENYIQSKVHITRKYKGQ